MLPKSAKNWSAHFAKRRLDSEFEGDSILLIKTDMNYGKALRLARSLSGLQQQQLAEKAEIDASYISLIEQGKRTPSVKFIHKLSKAIGIPPYLFTFLAMEREDNDLLDDAELTSIGEALTKLVLNYGANPTDNANSKKTKRNRAA